MDNFALRTHPLHMLTTAAPIKANYHPRSDAAAQVQACDLLGSSVWLGCVSKMSGESNNARTNRFPAPTTPPGVPKLNLNAITTPGVPKLNLNAIISNDVSPDGPQHSPSSDVCDVIRDLQVVRSWLGCNLPQEEALTKLQRENAEASASLARMLLHKQLSAGAPTPCSQGSMVAIASPVHRVEDGREMKVSSKVPQSSFPRSPSPIPEEYDYDDDCGSSYGCSDACSDVTDTSSDYMSEETANDVSYDDVNSAFGHLGFSLNFVIESYLPFLLLLPTPCSLFVCSRPLTPTYSMLPPVIVFGSEICLSSNLAFAQLCLL